MLIFVNSERCFVFSAELVVVALETQIIERQHGVAVVNVLINVEVAVTVSPPSSSVIVAVVAACSVIHGVIIITVLIILTCVFVVVSLVFFRS